MRQAQIQAKFDFCSLPSEWSEVGLVNLPVVREPLAVGQLAVQSGCSGRGEHALLPLPWHCKAFA